MGNGSGIPRNKKRKLSEWKKVQRTEADRERHRRFTESKELDGSLNSRKRLESRLEKYGITVEEFEGMMYRQGCVCGICRRPMENPQVDHDHRTGFVRGILCVPCNMAIGQLGDDSDSLLRAVNYLQRAEMNDPGRKW